MPEKTFGGKRSPAPCGTLTIRTRRTRFAGFAGPVNDPARSDHAYVVDTGGNIYRIDFDPVVSNWKMHLVAYTTGAGRKFLFAPALLAAPGGNVYVALGSGDREHPLQSQYPYSGVVNRFYVYRDNVTSTSVTNLDRVGRRFAAARRTARRI